jgi:hypothetical protein
MMKTLLAALALIAFVQPAQAQTVSNFASIAVIDNGEASSTINVAGIAGHITGLTLSLNGLSHTFPDDLVIGLRNEDLGLGIIFMSFVGEDKDITDINLTFSDLASGQLPESYTGDTLITSGTYLPSNFGGFSYAGYIEATSFADFNGFSANGEWTLVVNDLVAADIGSISGGWSMTFETEAGPAVPEPTTWAMMIGGFALAGLAMRRRPTISLSYMD